jgi:hypothetical protein
MLREAAEIEKRLVELEDDPLLKEVLEFYGKLYLSRFAQGQIFWVRGSGKKVLLYDYGQWIEREKIKKYQDLSEKKKKIVLEAEFTLDQQKINGMIKKWEALKKINHLKSEKEKRKLNARRDLLAEVLEYFLGNSGREYLWELAVVSEKIFWDFSEEEEAELEKVHPTLMTRAILSGSVGCYLLLAMGYIDFEFIKDYFKAYLLKETFWNQKGMNIYNFAYWDKEREESGGGKKVLKEYKKENSDLLEKWGQHLFEFMMKNYGNSIKHKSIFKCLRSCTEKSSGNGFPTGLNYHHFSDIEQMTQWCYYLFPYEKFVIRTNEQKEIVKKMASGEWEKFLNPRVRRMILRIFEDLKNEDEDYLEVAGL